MIETKDTIKALDTRQQCREKLPVWFGSRDNYYHPIIESLANASDEITNNFDSGVITVTLYEDLQTIEIEDTGRGMPIMGETEGVPNYVLLFEKLFSGTNYDNLENGKVTTGTNGVFCCVGNHTSLLFEVISYKNGKAHKIAYKNGGELIGYTEEKCDCNKHGTSIKFKLDPECYTSTTFDYQELKCILNRLAGANNKLTIILNHKDISETFKYDDKLDYITNNITQKASDFIVFKEKTYQDKVIDTQTNRELTEVNRVEAVISLTTEPFQQTFLNYTYLKEQGTIHEGVVDGLRKFFNRGVKKNKITVQDVEMSFNFVASILSNNVEFANQTKFSTKKALYKKIVSDYIVENMEIVKIEQPKVFEAMQKHLTSINLFNTKNEESIKNIKSKLTELSSKGVLSRKIDGLKDCDMRHSELEERIFIVDEGLSANSTIIEAFDNRYMGCLGLRGRFINSLKSSVKDVLNNEPALGIIKSLGCGIIIPDNEKKLFREFESFDINNLRYGKVGILCDADSFGKGISLSIITFFKKFMPQLLRESRIYFVISPRYEIRNKKLQSFYAYNEKERDEIINMLNKDFLDVSIRKGLGEFNKEEFWDLVLSPEAREKSFIKIEYEDSEDIDKLFDTLMGEDITSRKAFIKERIVNVDLNELD